MIADSPIVSESAPICGHTEPHAEDTEIHEEKKTENPRVPPRHFDSVQLRTLRIGKWLTSALILPGKRPKPVRNGRADCLRPI